MRAGLCGLAAALALIPGISTAAGPGGPTGPTLSPEIAREYVKPHDLIDIGGGRKINLYCMGSGDRTVLFDAGGSDWSVIWSLVQPALAGDARVCTYDRAGLGYSDPSPFPRTPVAIVEDMRTLIVAAKLPTPLVLVGHSLGGFNVKLYAALYPEDVAGLVLVGPSEERSSERSRELLRSRYGAAFAARSELRDNTFGTFLMERYRRCMEAARQGPMDPKSDTYRRCSDPVRTQMGDVVAAERARIQVGQNYQLAQASEILNSIYGDERGDVIFRDLFRPGVFGDKPLIVLTHGRFDPEDPMDAAAQVTWVALHQETARLSTRGKQRTLPNTSHNIELDDPQSIVDAVREVLKALGPVKKG